MPTQFLSRSVIERLESFPQEIDRDDLAEHFRLAGEDLEFARSQYGLEGQLGVAVQLCTLRWLGFIPEGLTVAPAAAIQSLAATLDVPPRALFDYSVRPQTRREHRPLVRAHADWRTFGEAGQALLGEWLIEVALEHERPTLLLAELGRELRARRIERPAIGRLGWGARSTLAGSSRWSEFSPNRATGIRKRSLVAGLWRWDPSPVRRSRWRCAP